nr:PREDICTED: uncharacterized protein LOC105662191 [Megachile rotundata]
MKGNRRGQHRRITVYVLHLLLQGKVISDKLLHASVTQRGQHSIGVQRELNVHREHKGETKSYGRKEEAKWCCASYERSDEEETKAKWAGIFLRRKRKIDGTIANGSCCSLTIAKPTLTNLHFHFFNSRLKLWPELSKEGCVHRVKWRSEFGNLGLWRFRDSGI